ncbi:MAG: glycoside hydrolase family 88 protein [Opitutaceae bacterium]|jgi:unsaturated rhamnogalacturonyl hydrolase|nr:glycoside hydrolase family 88 protein [Opitutaceae bacterium]
MKNTRPALSPLVNLVAERMTRIENQTIDETCPIGIIDFEHWEWPQGVGLYGLYKHYQEVRDTRILDTINAWFERRLRAGLPAKNVNTTAPMLTLAHLAGTGGDKTRLALCAEWAGWVMSEMPRTEDRALQHIVTGEANEHQVWADTLFMTVLFLAKMGVILKRRDYIEESIRQFLVHIKYLFDRKTGLWYHGWTFDGRHNFANALWARGNCWITAGIPDYLDIVRDLPPSIESYLIDTLAAQAAALAGCQRPDGLWTTLLDDPRSYVETSATAGFGYGILKSVRKGYLDNAFIETGRKALDAVVRHISPDGTVQQVSYGTGMGRDLDHYRKIPVCPMAYGQALALLLLNEGMKLGL